MAAAKPVSAIGAREPKLLTIGQVRNLLIAEFADLSESKLRFFEERGLVTPQRTESGYRKFTHRDVERLRLALQLQRDRYMPLNKIKDYFADLDAGRQPALPAAPETKSLRSRANKLTALDLVSQTGISDALLLMAQEAKLIGQAPFGVNDVEIAKNLVTLQTFGFTPRHFTALRTEAEREVGLIEGVIKPVLSRGDTASRAKADDVSRQLQALFNALRNEIIDRILGDVDPNSEG